MRIKESDDRGLDISALEALLARPDADADTRRTVEQEIRQIRAGMAGERDAAYAIEFYLGASRNWVTIHDLRLEVAGRVAQIDHLVINRLLDVWVCETKHFAEGVAVNEQGEWTAFYGRRAYGVPSPVEQNRRHMTVLEDAVDRGLINLPKRLGITIKPKFFPLVLVSDRARITRPERAAASRVDGLETVIKMDQFTATVMRTFDERSSFAMVKAVGTETLANVARSLATLHVPATFDWTARFGLSPTPTVPTMPSRVAVPQAEPAPVMPATAAPPAMPATPTTSTAMSACAACGKPISEAVIAFCAERPARFAGASYCMTCQRRYRAPR